MLSVLEEAFLEKRRQLDERGTRKARPPGPLIDGTLWYFRADDKQATQIQFKQTSTMFGHRFAIRCEELTTWKW